MTMYEIIEVVLGVPTGIAVSYAVIRMWSRAWHLSQAEVYNEVMKRGKAPEIRQPPQEY